MRPLHPHEVIDPENARRGVVSILAYLETRECALGAELKRASQLKPYSADWVAAWGRVLREGWAERAPDTPGRLLAVWRITPAGQAALSDFRAADRQRFDESLAARRR